MQSAVNRRAKRVVGNLPGTFWLIFDLVPLGVPLGLEVADREVADREVAGLEVGRVQA